MVYVHAAPYPCHMYRRVLPQTNELMQMLRGMSDPNTFMRTPSPVTKPQRAHQ